MEHREHPEHLNLRLALLAVFLTAVLGVYLGILYDTQVNHHQDYLTQSVRTIVQVEKVEASRGILTDRSGRTLVSNAFAYDLTFDASLLRGGQDQSQAILRLLQLCQDQGKSWVDTLPITQQSPFAYTVDDVSTAQRRRFLTYLSSLKESKQRLERYLLAHPELTEAAEEPEEEAEEAAAPASLWDRLRGLLRPSSSSNRPAVLTGDSPLDRLPPSALTASLLQDAGIEPADLLSWMAADMELPEGFTLGETRQVLGVRYELRLRGLGDNSRYVLCQDIDRTFISLLNDGAYAGAKVTRSSVRRYETDCAAHILGFVGALDPADLEDPAYADYPMDATVGKGGAEAAFEPWLRGRDGRRVMSVNSEGKTTGEYYSQEPQPGSTVELTLDLRLQQAVEDALAETVASMDEADGRDDRGAGAAVVRVGTGEILALASCPTFDLSAYRQEYAALTADPAAPLFNRATQGTYAPGSTIKPLTAVAALESGAVTLTERIRDTGRWYYPGDPTRSYANCWYRAGHGLLNITQAITASCNYFFAEMGYRMGMDTLNQYLSAFGLGEHTGVEIGDSAGTVAQNAAGQNQAPWAAFGQANQLYTPLQLANYMATLVSGGQHCEAHLLKAVKSYDNTRILATGNTTPINTVPISESTLTAVKTGMHDLTTSSLAPYFRQCVVDAGAKTGTAQLGTGITNNGVFVCFAPYDEPEVAVAIVIEKGGSGAALASTAVQILNAYFTDGETGAVTGEDQLLP